MSRRDEHDSGGGTPGGAARYVVHHHAASHDHFDLRLELDGVLKSWALPKGPSLSPGEKRLAIEVADHALDYAGFEGVIPTGRYGAGTVMLWDRGRWWATHPPTPDQLDIELRGEKLHGTWTLRRMSGKRNADGKQWLMIRRYGDDQAVLAPEDRSVLGGRSMDEIAEQGGKRAQPDLFADDDRA